MYPVLFRYGSLEITSFGVALSVAFLLSAWLASRAFPRYGLPADSSWQLLTWAMVGGIAGSKLWFVAETLARNPADLDRLFTVSGPLLSLGGLTWYGGFLGGAIAVLIVARQSGLPLAPVCDATAPSLALGQGIGRIGCFLVGDDWGRPTDSVWGIAFPQGVEPTEVPVHATQLYEMAWLFAVTALLWRRLGRSPSVFGEYLVLAGVGRLWIELFRRNPPLVGPFTNAQVTALVCIALGAALWLARSRSKSAVTLRTT
jgi:phosphatidylglycerol:prolipoprotein diacylglycerol transferase